MNKKNILAIDSTFDTCSIALLYKGKIFNKCSFSEKQHLEKIFPIIEQCFLESGANLKDVDIVGFSCGPGSFSGIRVSIGIAQSLSFAVGLKLVSISSLLTLAQRVYRKFGIKKVLIASDAKMGKIYSACYKFQNGCWFGKKTESMIFPEDFLKKINHLRGKWAIAGTGWSIYPFLKKTILKLYETDVIFPNALDMFPLIFYKLKKKKFICINDIQPIYFY